MIHSTEHFLSHDHCGKQVYKVLSCLYSKRQGKFRSILGHAWSYTANKGWSLNTSKSRASHEKGFP